MTFNEDIFIIDCWIDTESKENDLIELIKKLKEFNIEILLTGHYPIKPEIQKMVDYFIYDKNNPLLLQEEFRAYDVASTRWTSTTAWKVENSVEFHHDYAIWTTWKNSFNFAKYLGKKYIHFLEYDNLIDTFQYRQAFLEESRRHDIIIYEYRENSSCNKELGEYCATFIYSIKTDIALELVNKVKNKVDYFMGKPQGWQLERVFLKYAKEVTSDIFVSKYIANNNELNTQAVWNRDGILRNGEAFQVYLGVDENKTLYVHLISGFFDHQIEKSLLVEVVYDKFKKFIKLPTDEYVLEEIGQYRKGDRVKVYYEGTEIFNEYLKDDFNKFYKLNKVTMNIVDKPHTIKMNFLDGAYTEIFDNTGQKYNVDFINKKTNNIEYSSEIKANGWAKCIKEYFIDWRIVIKGQNYYHEYDFDLVNKRVLISFESKSLGDTIAWIPYVEEFRKKHDCTIICSTFHNHLFKAIYPKIKFVLPGEIVHDLYALYRIGFFKKDNVYDALKHPEDPRKQPLQKVASDILGLEYKEIRPVFQNKTKKKKQVVFGIHSTAQAKYWNNPNGWQGVVDYLKQLNYDVIHLSNEENGYMGNYIPKGVKQLKKSTIQDVIKVIQESEIFIGISSGLSWISWASGTPTILISGFTDKNLEPTENVYRIINENVCHGCWSRHYFDPSDWNWCPDHKNTTKMFECTKSITSEEVIENINKILQL